MQAAGGGCDDLTGRAASDSAAFIHDRRAAGAVDRAVYAATGQPRVDGVDDGVNVFLCDVAADEFQYGLAELGACGHVMLHAAFPVMIHACKALQFQQSNRDLYDTASVVSAPQFSLHVRW